MKVIHQPPVSRKAMNLAYMVTQCARRFPKRTALIWREKSWTWSELDARISALARGLIDLGVQPGGAVLVHSKNSNEMLESMLATFRIGAVWVPTNFRLTTDEVAYMAEVTQPSIMLCQTDFPEHADAVNRVMPGIRRVWLTGEKQGQDGAPHASELIDLQIGRTVANASVQWDSACWLFFTSGTTGRPKAAVLTHGQMGFVITNHLCDLMPGTTEEDGSLVVAPLSHGAGVHQLNMIARGGKTVLMPSDKFEPASALALIEQYRLTNLFTVPTILKMLVEDPSMDRYDYSSLRYVVYAGGPMYRKDQQLALQKLGPVLVQYYGLTEVTGNITVLPPREHDDDSEESRPGTCGFERTGMQVSIQDDAGNELEAGRTGEICVIGPAVFAGYFDNPEANEKSFRNGWFCTGDLGYRDSEGYVYLTGRSSDMYISGGSNIHPREIEEKMLTHEAISEVSIVGVPDPKWGEVGVAVCVLRAGAELDEAATLDWMASRVARYKLPKRVFFWDALPKSGYGKVPKVLVKEELRRRGLLASTGKYVRTIKHPGPVSPTRMQCAAAILRAVDVELPRGVTVLQGLSDAVRSHGVSSAVFSICEGSLGPMTYVMPALSDSPKHVAYFSKRLQADGPVHIQSGSITYGLRDGAPCVHCHLLWTESDGSRRSGHLLAAESQVEAPVRLKAWMLDGAGFKVAPDPETNFDLLQVSTDAAPSAGANAFVLRVGPNQDLCLTLEAFCAEHNIRSGSIRGGVGSLNGAVFDDGRTVEALVAEAFIRRGTIETGGEGEPRADLDIALVAHTGEIAEGRLRRGENPVLITFELVIEIQDDESSAGRNS